MSKIMLLLFTIAFVAIVQALPHSQPCYGGGGRAPPPPPPRYQPNPYYYNYYGPPPPPPPPAAAGTTVAPATGATPINNGMAGPPLSEEDQATLNRLYAAYTAANTPTTAAPA